MSFSLSDLEFVCVCVSVSQAISVSVSMSISLLSILFLSLFLNLNLSRILSLPLCLCLSVVSLSLSLSLCLCHCMCRTLSSSVVLFLVFPLPPALPLVHSLRELVPQLFVGRRLKSKADRSTRTQMTQNTPGPRRSTLKLSDPGLKVTFKPVSLNFKVLLPVASTILISNVVILSI